MLIIIVDYKKPHKSRKNPLILVLKKTKFFQTLREREVNVLFCGDWNWFDTSRSERERGGEFVICAESLGLHNAITLVIHNDDVNHTSRSPTRFARDDATHDVAPADVAT